VQLDLTDPIAHRGDRRAVLELLAAYGERFDRGDFEAFAELFSQGTWFPTEHAGPGAAVVRQWCAEQVQLHDGLPRTRHLTSNLWLDLDVVSGTGAAESHVTVWQGMGGFPLQVVFAGRFHDRLHRIGDRWCFEQRRVEPELMGDLSRHLRCSCTG
jgi:hypothetical protein